MRRIPLSSRYESESTTIITFMSSSQRLAVSISSGESVSADQMRKEKKAMMYTAAIREKGIE